MNANNPYASPTYEPPRPTLWHFWRCALWYAFGFFVFMTCAATLVLVAVVLVEWLRPSPRGFGPTEGWYLLGGVYLVLYVPASLVFGVAEAHRHFAKLRAEGKEP